MSLLDALHGAYKAEGSGAVPTTTREILDCGWRWVEGSDEGRQLLQGMRTMRGKASRNRDATAQDLARNPEMDWELREPMERSLEGFDAVARTLEALEAAVAAEDRESTPSLLEVLEAAGKQITAAGNDMKAWMEAPVRRCPRCGARHEFHCERCGLDTLVPDPKQVRDKTVKTATLPPAFGPVYRSYMAVVSGEASLPEVLSALDGLEHDMRTKRGYAEAWQRYRGTDVAEKLVSTVDEVLEGIQRMRQAAFTRETRDLNEGWALIFGSGSQVETDTNRVLEEGGRRVHRDCCSTTDSVVFSGE